MSEIVLDKVCKRFPDGTDAVRDASFTIHDGEFFILVGPSGSGKSTLLNMIVGLESTSEGEIRVNGRLINDLDPKDRNMAMVFQSYAIYPHMTVRENMAFPLRLAGLSREEIERRVEDTAAVLGLTDLLQRKPRTLSGGQRQRVAMGRAIVREPAAFLLDEPLSNLDARLRVQMRAEIARIQKHLGITTIYVTHDQAEAMTLGDRVAVLQGGVVQQVGTPRELYDHPANLFVAGFIGSPTMNLLPAEFNGSRIILPMAQVDPPERLRSFLGDQPRPLIAGIRPEHIYDAGVNLDEGMTEPIFHVQVDMVEWLGSDLYIYFQVPVGDGTVPPLPVPDLDRITSREGKITMTARLPGTSHAAEGKEQSLRLNPKEIHLFEGSDQDNLLNYRNKWR